MWHCITQQSWLLSVEDMHHKYSLEGASQAALHVICRLMCVLHSRLEEELSTAWLLYRTYCNNMLTASCSSHALC